MEAATPSPRLSAPAVDGDGERQVVARVHAENHEGHASRAAARARLFATSSPEAREALGTLLFALGPGEERSYYERILRAIEARIGQRWTNELMGSVSDLTLEQALLLGRTFTQ